MGLFDNIRGEILEEFESFIPSEIWQSKTYNTGFSVYDKSKVCMNNPTINSLVAMLEEKRWGYYPICPRCGCEKVYLLSNNRGYRCGGSECRIGFNVFYGTILLNTQLGINKWYDLATAYRGNNKLSTRGLAKDLELTQKSVWWMLLKLKSNPLFLEKDVPILHILLTPKKITANNYISKKPTYEEYRKSCIKILTKTYPSDSICLHTLKTVLDLIKVDFNSSPKAFCEKYNISPCNLYRYLSGARKMPISKAIDLNNEINYNSMIHYESLLEVRNIA